MARPSIADRYLKTLESNAIESTPRSPPKSVKSPEKVKESPQRPSAGLTTSDSNRSVPQADFPGFSFSPKRSIDVSPKRAIDPTPRTLDPKRADMDKLHSTSTANRTSPSRAVPQASHTTTQLSPTRAQTSSTRTGSSPVRSQTSPNGTQTSPTRALPTQLAQPISPTRTQASPTRTQASPTRTQASPTRTQASPTRTQASPTRALPSFTPQTSSTRIQAPQTANQASYSRDQSTQSTYKGSPSRAQPTHDIQQTSPARALPTRALPASSPLTGNGSPSPVRSPVRSSANTSPVRPLPSLGQKPDRHLLMHNQDLTPSQVSWDSERKNWQAYEYLCHIVEAKEWMEKVLGEQLPPAEQFPESLQNGIFLAKIVEKLRPELMKWPVFEHKRLQYRHTENITLFFDLLSELNIPQLFLFDMTDLYEKRNLPKVIYCIHAVSHFVAESNFAVSAVDNLVGKLEFSDDQLLTTEKGLAGRKMPNFGAMTRQLSGKQPKMEELVPESANDPVEEIDEEEEAEEDEYSRKEYVPTYSDSEDDAPLDIAPPRRYRRRDRPSTQNVRDPSYERGHRRERDISNRQSSLSSLSSLYNERYSQYDKRQYRGYGYRNLSSNGSFRSKILSAAEVMLMELEELEPEITEFQAICRGTLARRKQRGQFEHPEAISLAIKLQAAARGLLHRRKDVRKVPLLNEEELKCLVQFQSVIRASFARKKFSATAGKANDIVGFQSLVRGVLTRRAIGKLESVVHSRDSIKLIVALQSGFRGVLVRFQLGCLYDDLESQLPSVIMLQAHARGALIRKFNRSTRDSWHNNVDKIITLQSVWRAKAQGSRYRTLLDESNPSLKTLKPFLHLYEDNDSDYKSEVELEAIMRDISKKLKHNEQVQSRIDQLDMKIALLVKNNIAIDELLLQQQRQNQDLRKQLQQEKQIDDEFGIGTRGRVAHQLNSAAGSLKDHFDIKLLQKPSRERFELYQGLLYILQTQATYISKLMNNVPPKSLDMSELVLSVFGGAKTKREQFYLLKQISSSITQSTVGSAENTVAWSIVSHLNHSKESTQIARKILAPATEKLKALSEQILEYDPHLIYEHITGGADLNAEEAIQDPAVRTLFVQNLRWLREVTLVIVQSLASNMNLLPYHIRYLGREVYREVLRFSNDREEALSAVGQVIISQFLQPALLAADSLDLVDAAVGNTTKNLALVGRVLHQVGVMQPFSSVGSTDIYLRPLNEFVKSSAHQLSLQLQNSVVECPDLQSHFNMSEFDDITMHDRPALFISMDNLLALHYMCYNNIATIAPSNDNTLKPLVQQLGPLPKDSREMLDLARFKDVKLELNPKYCAASLSASSHESSSLLATTKRCLVYVLRIQNAQPDLMSVLVNPVEVEDELRYNLFLDADNNRELAGELANLTFRELKLLTLEKVLELESSGAVSRENDYQALINAIANDIRNKDSVRQKKNMNIENKRRTLRSLEEKGAYLEQRLESYSKHIDEALESLQSEAAYHQAQVAGSKRFQKFQLPGTKPHHGSELQNGPKYGQYRTNADKLYERGIIVRLLGYTDRQRKDVHVTFSCDQVVVFQIDVTYKGILLPNGHAEITLDDLLAHQYQNQQQLGFIGGDLQFNTNRLLQLILEKFFNLQHQ